MSHSFTKPGPKNPLLRTPQFNLPPNARGRVALGITAAAALGRFELQVCQECATVQYPPREACGHCLSPRLTWREQSGAGLLLATTTLAHSNDLYFSERLPWRLGMVQLDAGPSLMVYLHADIGEAPQRLRVGARLDRAGQAVLIGFPDLERTDMADDKMLREFGSDPKFRKVLVTDGKSEVGQAMVQSLIGAGADLIWVGQAEPWKKVPALDKLAALPQVTPIAESAPWEGPLLALHRLMQRYPEQRLLLCPVDMPELHLAALQELVAAAAQEPQGIHLAHDGLRLQPLLGVYPSSIPLRQHLAASIDGGERRLQSWLAAHPCNPVPLDPRALRNVNCLNDDRLQRDQPSA